MKIICGRLTASLLTCAALAVVVPSGAQAAGAASELTLKRTVGGVSRSASLSCDPAGGTHRRAQEACALLASVNGNFKALTPSADAVCPPAGEPVRVSVSGQWRGKRVFQEETFANDCEVLRRTGSLFAF
ncbi:SSI family serine proteinase inhibitor [Streptomyces lavendulae]|uniref:SSI family serine proteinase inhibitor n=1 Tax=Streptomyces lavendulae TaxID=1914 RepID=UPI0036EFC359